VLGELSQAFRDLYAMIPPTLIMTDVVTEIMVELLSVLALASKEIKQGRLSECASTCTLPVAQYSTVKFTKKLWESVRLRLFSDDWID
jgi:hypothetical protein